MLWNTRHLAYDTRRGLRAGRYSAQFDKGIIPLQLHDDSPCRVTRVWVPQALPNGVHSSSLGANEAALESNEGKNEGDIFPKRQCDFHKRLAT